MKHKSFPFILLCLLIIEYHKQKLVSIVKRKVSRCSSIPASSLSISWNQLSSADCTRSGGCVTLNGRCYSDQVWEISLCSQSNCGGQRDGQNSIEVMKCLKTPYALCGSINTTEEVCKLRNCCFYGAGLCGFPTSITSDSKKKEVLVSIIITCHNQEDYIRDSMLSIAFQSFSSWELIVVDDGTEEKKCFSEALKVRRYIVRRFKQIDGDQISIHFKKNTGVAHTRNWGAKKSIGSHICFLDADDIISPQYMYKAAMIIHKKPQTYLVYGDLQFFDNDDKQDIWVTVPSLDFDVSVRNAPLGPLPIMCVIKRSVFEEVGGFEYELIYGMEDFDVWVRLLRLGQAKNHMHLFKKVNGPAAWYRYKRNSLSRKSQYELFAVNLFRIKFEKYFSETSKDIASVYCRVNEDFLQKMESSLLLNTHSCLSAILISLASHKLSKRHQYLSKLSKALYICHHVGETSKSYTVSNTLIQNVYQFIMQEDGHHNFNRSFSNCQQNFLSLWGR